MQYTAFSIQKGQNRKSQKLEFRLKFAFLLSFVMPNKRHFVMKFMIGQISD